MGLNILQTPVRFHPFMGGVENHVLYLSTQLVRRGHKVKVLCANEPNSQVSQLAGISVQRMKHYGKVANTNITPCLPVRVLQSNYDIIHTHMPTPWSADWSVAIARCMGKRSIITIHNDMGKCDRFGSMVLGLYRETLMRVTLRLADRIVVVNPDWETTFAHTARFLRPLRDKVVVIPNGVDTTLFRRRGERRSPSTLLFVSVLDRHHRFKGFEYLLQALQTVRNSQPDVQLIVVGDGELKREYFDLARKLGLEANVSFEGAKTQSELAPYYSRTSVFVLPSTEIEGFGIVLLEAMASGAAVVTTSIAGVASEITSRECGFVVSPKDASALAEAISYLLAHPDIAAEMGKRGSELVAENYSWELVAEQVEAVYRELTG